MANASNAQTSFLGGEWSPRSQGHFDDPRYLISCNVLLNHVPIEDGSAPRRPGFAHLAPTRGGVAGRIHNFTYDTAFPYEIEFTDGHIRAFQERALLTNDTQVVSSISTAQPAVITVTATNWATNDQIIFTPSDALTAETLPLLLNRAFSIVAISATQYAISDAITGAPVAGATLGWVGGLTLAASQVADVVAPYVNGDWASVRGVQDETTMTLLHGSYAPEILTATDLGNGNATFSLAAASFLDGPYLDPLVQSQITPDALTGVVNLTLSYAAYDSTVAYAIGDFVSASGVSYRNLTSPNQGNTPSSHPANWAIASPGDILGPNGFTATDIGRHIRLFSEPPLWVTGTTYAIGNVVSYNGSYWTALIVMVGATPAAGSINPNQPGNLATTWAVNPSGAKWTWGIITALSTSGQVAQNLGSVIGSVTNKSRAFDSNTQQTQVTGCTGGADDYVGKNFSAGAQSISSARVYPTTDSGWNGITANVTTTLSLYGKHTLPGSSSDGTLLGSTTAPSPSKNPVTIVSNDQTTNWEYLWVRIQGEPSGYSEVLLSEVQFFTAGNPVGSGVALQLRGDPLLYTSAVRTWRLGLYNGSTPTWPTCGCYHEGRLWLGGAVKNRFDASVSNGVDRDKGTFNFAPTAPDGSVGEANGISYTMNSSDLNQLLWLSPGARGIIGGTNGGEWLISAPTAGAIGPTNIKAVRVTDYGCANVEPRNTGLTTAFVQKFERRLIEYLSDAFSGKFQGPDLSEKAMHLTRTGIKEIAYVEGESPTIWCRMGDGSIAGVVYKRVSSLASQPPEFAGWHSHKHGGDRVFTSITAGGAAAGALTALYATTYDPSTGIYHVEALTELPAQQAAITASWFLDDAVVPTSAVSVFVAPTGHAEAGAPNSIQFNGLWHLNGQEVTVFAAGVDCGDYAVADGSVIVPFGAGDGLFTWRWLTQLSSKQEDNPYNVSIDQGAVTIPAVIGLNYRSRGQLLRPAMPQQAGTQNGPAVGKKRRNHQMVAILSDTQGISFGTTFDNLRPAIFETPGLSPVSKLELFSGVFQGPVDDIYSYDGMLAWEISRPYPATVCALGGFLQTQDK